MPHPSKDKKQKKTFKERKVLVSRIEEAKSIKARYTDKVPVIVERSPREKNLPYLDKTKFLIPLDLTLSQLLGVIRHRMQLKESQTFYLVVNGKTLVSLSTTISELYKTEKDEDGFLYFHYASQDMFGGW